MAVFFNGAVLQRTYGSGALGGGAREVNAVVTATRTDEDVVTVTLTISQAPNMTPAELTDYQAFVELLDEEQDLAAALIALDDATP